MATTKIAPPARPSSTPKISKRALLVGVSFCALTAVAIWMLVTPAVPLGIVGEWVWNRSTSPPGTGIALVFPTVAGVVYLAVVVGLGRLLNRSEGFIILALPLLFVAGGIWHLGLGEMSRPGFGMERWIPALHYTSTSGYLAVAKEIPDARTFLAGYKEWVRGADNFHLGTHPPGLILLSRAVWDYIGQRPDMGARLESLAPPRLYDGFALIPEGLTPRDRQTLVALALLSWIVSLATVFPLYGLARLGASPIEAWWGAAFWPMIPASLLFVPISDVLYPFLAVGSVALALAGYRGNVGFFALMGGVLCWLGMMLSLAFVVVLGLVLGTLIVVGLFDGKWYRLLVMGIAFVAGWGLPTAFLLEVADVNMVEIWGINLSKHAGFYEAMPRSYLPWLGINLVEFAVMVTPALFGSALILGLGWGLRRNASAVDRLTLVWLAFIVALDCSGRNRSEAARLWLFLTPLGLPGAARFLHWITPPKRFPWGLVGVGTLALALHGFAWGWVEPLLPVALVP